MGEKIPCAKCLKYYEETQCIDIALQNAVQTGHTNCLQRHIDEGADVNSVNMNGQTLLTLAVNPWNALCLEPLIEAGADVNYKMRDGSTALHKASYFGTCESVELLIKAGADVNARNEHGDTPLMLAAMDYEAFPRGGKRLEILLFEGAKINITNKRYQNAIQSHVASNLHTTGRIIGESVICCWLLGKLNPTLSPSSLNCYKKSLEIASSICAGTRSEGIC